MLAIASMFGSVAVALWCAKIGMLEMWSTSGTTSPTSGEVFEQVVRVLTCFSCMRPIAMPWSASYSGGYGSTSH